MADDANPSFFETVARPMFEARAARAAHYAGLCLGAAMPTAASMAREDVDARAVADAMRSGEPGALLKALNTIVTRDIGCAP